MINQHPARKRDVLRWWQYKYRKTFFSCTVREQHWIISSRETRWKPVKIQDLTELLPHWISHEILLNFPWILLNFSNGKIVNRRLSVNRNLIRKKWNWGTVEVCGLSKQKGKDIINRRPIRNVARINRFKNYLFIFSF